MFDQILLVKIPFVNFVTTLLLIKQYCFHILCVVLVLAFIEQSTCQINYCKLYATFSGNKGI